MKRALLAIVILCAWRSLAFAAIERSSPNIAANADGYLVVWGQDTLCESSNCSAKSSVAGLRLDANGAVIGFPFLITTTDEDPMSVTGAGSAGWLVQTTTSMVLVDESGHVSNLPGSFPNEDLGTHVFIGDGWIVARGDILVHQLLDGTIASAHSLIADPTTLLSEALGASADGRILAAWTDGTTYSIEQVDDTGTPTTPPATLPMADSNAVTSTSPQLRITGTTTGWLVYSFSEALTQLYAVDFDGTVTIQPLPNSDTNGATDQRFGLPSMTGVTWVDVLVTDSSGELDNTLVFTELTSEGSGFDPPLSKTTSIAANVLGARVAATGGFVLVDQVATEAATDVMIEVFDATDTLTATTGIPDAQHADGCSVAGDPSASMASMVLVLVAWSLATRRKVRA